MKRYFSIPLILTISSAYADEVLLPVEVKEAHEKEQKEFRSTDSTSLLHMTPGIHLRGAGGISAQPSVNGFSNDRLNIRIDDAVVTSSCSNHMNSPLSYVDSFKVSTMDVYAGLSPVSAGGDSLGSSILVKTMVPVFSEDESIRKKLSLSSFFRSNNNNSGASLNAEVASDKYSFQYSGTDEKALRYKTGSGKRLKGTIYNQNNQTMKIARKTDSGVMALKMSRAIVPYQGFVNQYMDMNDNKSDTAQLTYEGDVRGHYIEASASHQNTNHYMDKLSSERAGKMPMFTLSDETNANVKITKDMSSGHTVKAGVEYHQYRLADWWEPVTGAGAMSPGNFQSIRNGKRDRIGLFSELRLRTSEKLSFLTGIRTDIVRMDTGDVTGYNSGNNAPNDAAAFNQKDRTKRDNNWDATLSGRYALGQETHFDFGYTRKTRSPNLYERYAWAGNVTNPGASGPIRMDMRMINWFGDGNGYVGDVGLKPEVAHTFQTELKHAEANGDVEASLTPYFSYVEDYIDADLLATSGGVNYLRFANHDAVLFGGNASASVKVVKNDRMGDLKFSVLSSYVRGYRTDKKSDLYHMMPLNGKLRLEHLTDKLSTKLDLVLVGKKSTVSNLRGEPETAGYALLDISSAYRFSSRVMMEVAVLNLLDKEYSHPMGGVDVLNFAASSRTPVLSMGRSINTMVKFDF